MKKDLFVRLLLIAGVAFCAYNLGYYYAKHEVVEKALKDKKPCYDLYDIYLITN